MKILVLRQTEKKREVKLIEKEEKRKTKGDRVNVLLVRQKETGVEGIKRTKE